MVNRDVSKEWDDDEAARHICLWILIGITFALAVAALVLAIIELRSATDRTMTSNLGTCRDLERAIADLCDG